MDAELSQKQLKSNYSSFMWHAAFLSLTVNFMDVDTIIPAMLLKSGGTSFHVGFLAAIMVGGARIFQLLFAGFLSNKERKKAYILLGINLRIISLTGLALLLLLWSGAGGAVLIPGIFLFISLFSVSGAFANVTYVDLLGKSIATHQRKHFFTRKQVITSVSILVSALAAREILKRVAPPLNYGLLFSLAAALLAVASIGFWKIIERKSIIKKTTTPAAAIRRIPREIAANSNLKNYLILNNILGVSVSVMPFMVLFARKQLMLSDRLIGNFLLMKIAGMLLASLAISRFSHGRSYRGVLRLCVLAAVLIPLSAMLFAGHAFAYQFVFFISGIFTSAYRIAMSGILVEISDESNRSLYTGISGAGDITTALFPLIVGALLPVAGFTTIFWLCAFIVATGYYFAQKMDCFRARSLVQKAV